MMHLLRRFSTVKLRFGKYSGLTLDEVQCQDPRYIDWLKRTDSIRKYPDLCDELGIIREQANTRKSEKRCWGTVGGGGGGNDGTGFGDSRDAWGYGQSSHRSSTYRAKSSGNGYYPKSQNNYSQPRFNFPSRSNYNSAVKAKKLDESPISPDCKLTFGKHDGLTYQEVFDQHPDYCQWIITKMFSERVSFGALRLGFYAQQRWLQPKVETAELLSIKVDREFLKDKAFVIAGSSPLGVPKDSIQALIVHCGGRVASDVTSKTSGLIRLGEHRVDGVEVQKTSKLQKAEKHGVQVYSLQEFLDHVKSDHGEEFKW